MKIQLYMALVWLAGLSACKEAEPVPVNPVPFISLDSLSRSSVKEFTDSLVIYVRYEDGDGDLGEINPDINSLEVQDQRFQKADAYFIPPQAPTDKQLRIEGRLAIRLRNLFLLGTGNSETTAFRIRLRDRAGNWSNSINTPNIAITR